MDRDDDTKVIIEKRAPTDESIRIMREMEAAAEERVRWRVTTPPNNEFHFTAHRWQDPKSLSDKVGIQLYLQNREFRLEFEIVRDIRLDPNEIYARVREKVVEALAEEITYGTFEAILTNTKGR